MSPITDIQVDYPTGYDSAATIMGLPLNRQTYTCNGGLSVSSTTLTVSSGGLYDLTDLELPCLLLFEGGEIWYIEDGDVQSATVLTINFSQRAKMGTTTQIHTDGEEVYAYFSGKQHEMLLDLLVNLEKYPMVQGLQGGAPTVVGEAYIDTNYDIYVSFNGSTFTKLTSADHTNLDDIPTGASTKVHGSQYLNSVDGLSSWHGAIAGDHITGGDDHTHLVDASGVKRVAHGSALPTGEAIGQIFLDDGDLYFIYDGDLDFDEFYGIPAGSILPFPPATGCPAGWSAYTTLNSSAYARVKIGGTGTTAGSNTHTHTISEIKQHQHTILEDTCTSSSDGNHNHSFKIQGSGPIGQCLFSTNYATASDTVTGGTAHTGGTQEASATSGLTSGSMVSSFVTDAGSSEPPYTTMKWCKKD